jgi:hypothetical protein
VGGLVLRSRITKTGSGLTLRFELSNNGWSKGRRRRKSFAVLSLDAFVGASCEPLRERWRCMFELNPAGRRCLSSVATPPVFAERPIPPLCPSVSSRVHQSFTSRVSSLRLRAPCGIAGDAKRPELRSHTKRLNECGGVCAASENTSVLISSRSNLRVSSGPRSLCAQSRDHNLRPQSIEELSPCC